MHGYWPNDDYDDSVPPWERPNTKQDEPEDAGDVYLHKAEEAMRAEEARLAALPDSIVVMGHPNIMRIGEPRTPTAGDWGYDADRPLRNWEAKMRHGE